jgi:hypothetical protein
VVRVRVAVVRARGGGVVAASSSRRVIVSATRVLSAARVAAAPAPGSPGTVRYRGRADVHIGQYVAADVGPETPQGLLGRVVSARVRADSTVVAIEPASLFEVVPEGSLRPAPARASKVNARAAARAFRRGLICAAGVGAELSGSLAVRLIPSFKLRWSLDGVEQVEAKATIRGRADLLAAIGGGGACSLEETSVASWNAPALRFFAGPVPVVVVPRTTLYVSAEASAVAAVEAGLHGQLNATAGLSYDGDVHAIGSFRHHFTYTPPATRVTASLGARVIPAITFLIYGQAGPRFDLSTGLQLDAEANGDPWWKLTAPVELRAGLEVPNLDDLSIPQQTVFSREFPIAQAEPGPKPEPGRTPEPGRMPEPSTTSPAAGFERARISWNTGATDVDLHVWDASGNHAWFRAPDAIPGGELSEDDRYGFGPEHFRERSGAGRALTYGLCYFDDSGAGATTVSVRLTDPDGSTREFSRALAREGDHVLIGSSPAGSAFVPADGWCKP